MKNIILSAVLGLSSIIAPVAAHAGTPAEFMRGRAHHERAAVVQPVFARRVMAQPTYVQPTYAQPAYVQPTFVQPTYAQPVFAQPVIAHHDDRGDRRDDRDHGRETRRDDSRFDRGHQRDEGRGQRDRGGWRR